MTTECLLDFHGYDPVDRVASTAYASRSVSIAQVPTRWELLHFLYSPDLV